MTLNEKTNGVCRYFAFATNYRSQCTVVGIIDFGLVVLCVVYILEVGLGSTVFVLTIGLGVGTLSYTVGRWCWLVLHN